MGRMSFLEWVGLFVALYMLFDVYQHGGYGWFDKFKTADKAAVSKSVTQ